MTLFERVMKAGTRSSTASASGTASGNAAATGNIPTINLDESVQQTSRMLNVQYRMNSLISDWSSHEMYLHEIYFMITCQSFIKCPSKPHKVHLTSGF